MSEKLNRKILLSGDINEESIQKVIEDIIAINEEDDKRSVQCKDWTRIPIQLFINSGGGNVYDGFALIDIMRQSKTPIHTITIGSAMSMAMMIFMAGHKRYVGEYSTLMFHDISALVHDKTESIRARLGELNRLQAMICTVVATNSEVPPEVLIEHLNKKEDWYIASDEALKLGLAHDYFRWS